MMTNSVGCFDVMLSHVCIFKINKISDSRTSDKMNKDTTKLDIGGYRDFSIDHSLLEMEKKVDITHR